MSRESETTLLHKILVAMTSGLSRAFRNQAGVGYYGKVEHYHKPGVANLQAGDVVIRNARVLRSGLAVGASDIIGWTSRTVTPEWVGRRVAVFTAVEVKSRTGLTEQQADFLSAVHYAGGYSCEAHSVEFVQQMSGWVPSTVL